MYNFQTNKWEKVNEKKKNFNNPKIERKEIHRREKK